MFKKLINRIVEKDLIRRYFYLILAQFVGAVSYNLLLYPAKIVAGGGNGLAIVVEEIFHIPPSRFILVFSVAVLIISVLVIGIEKSSGAVVATFVYPLFVDLTSGITSILSVSESDMILICLFAGVISGWASGTVYKTGFSSGGVSLINQMLYEKFRISVSKSSFLINMIIVTLGSLCYGIENIMYAVIVLFISSIVIDRVLLGISNNKVFYIITTKEKEVRDYLMNDIGHGITEFNIVSGYLNKKGQALMTVVPTKEYTKITRGIKNIDEEAFFVVVDSYQTFNGA